MTSAFRRLWLLTILSPAYAISSAAYAQPAPSAAKVIRQQPIGQTGSNDPTITERRVDIVLER